MSPAELEHASRELCRLRGVDPDGLDEGRQVRRWQLVQDEVIRQDQVARALASVGGSQVDLDQLGTMTYKLRQAGVYSGVVVAPSRPDLVHEVTAKLRTIEKRLMASQLGAEIARALVNNNTVESFHLRSFMDQGHPTGFHLHVHGTQTNSGMHPHNTEVRLETNYFGDAGKLLANVFPVAGWEEMKGEVEVHRSDLRPLLQETEIDGAEVIERIRQATDQRQQKEQASQERAGADRPRGM